MSEKKRSSHKLNGIWFEFVGFDVHACPEHAAAYKCASRVNINQPGFISFRCNEPMPFWRGALGGKGDRSNVGVRAGGPQGPGGGEERGCAGEVGARRRREEGEGPGQGCFEESWRRTSEGKRKEENIRVRQVLEVRVRSSGCSMHKLALASLQLKARWSSQKTKMLLDFRRGQNDKQRGVGVKEAGWGLQNTGCLSCLVGSSNTQGVRNGAKLRSRAGRSGGANISTTTPSTWLEVHWGLGNPCSSKWGFVTAHSLMFLKHLGPVVGKSRVKPRRKRLILPAEGGRISFQ